MTRSDRRRHREGKASRLTPGLAVCVVACALSLGAITQVAWAQHHYHVNCVGHGFVHGESTTDGSFFSRVLYGCGSGPRHCAIYNYGSFVGDLAVGGTSTCNAWSYTYGTYVECASSARVFYSGVFSSHDHYAANWCG